MQRGFDEILGKVYKLKELFDNNSIPRLHNHEVNPGLDISSRENYLYFTLPVSLNFQRNSPALWKSALATYLDSETNYLFFPEKVVERSFEEIQRDLIKHKLALQKNKHTDIWIKISHTLNKYFENDPRMIIKSAQNCVVRTKNILQISQKKDFPYLSGNKMANYWLYILHQFTDIKLRNLHKISIIPDTHVLQCSIKLGISSEKDDPVAVAEKWFEILKKSDLQPIDMHPVLWNWSRNGFVPEV